jgi:hypothetical protein
MTTAGLNATDPTTDGESARIAPADDSLPTPPDHEDPDHEDPDHEDPDHEDPVRESDQAEPENTEVPDAILD